MGFRFLPIKPIFFITWYLTRSTPIQRHRTSSVDFERGCFGGTFSPISSALHKFKAFESAAVAMALDGVVSSPHRRSQSGQSAFSSPSFRKPYSKGDEFESCSALFQRHRFLLTALALLAFLCTVYLYFAITLGAGESCSGLTGAAKALCQVDQAKATIAKGKLKFH